MPKFNTTIDDPNPLIDYEPVGAWIPGTASNDPYADQYSNGGTFTLCTSSGSTASFSFNGTGVWIFGAKRGNHGPYNVTLDNVTFNGNGSSPDPGIFQTPLFGAGNLEMGLHKVTLTNALTDTKAPFLDIDFITWESDIGTDSESISGTTMQDTDPSFSYSPQLAWSTNVENSGSFNGGTGHSTFTPNASVTYTFNGDAVSIFGTVGQKNGIYSAQLDSGKAQTFNATRQSTIAQTMIFFADNLGPGQHQVKLTNEATTNGQGLFIDYAVASTVPSVSGSKSGISGGAIGGIVVGVIALVGIVVALLFFMRRRRRQADDGEKMDFNVAQPYTPSAMTRQGVVSHGTVQPGYAASHQQPSGATYSGVQSYVQPDYGYQNNSQFGYPTTAAESQFQGVGGSSGSRSDYSTHRTQQSEGSALPNPYPASDGGYPSIQPVVPTPSGSTPAPRKGQPVRMGPAASQALDHVPPEQLHASRMQVEGRPQDFGHVPVEGELPPPDYSQATEPYRPSQ